MEQKYVKMLTNGGYSHDEIIGKVYPVSAEFYGLVEISAKDLGWNSHVFTENNRFSFEVGTECKFVSKPSKSKSKWQKGERIYNLETFLNQDYIMFCGKVYHKGWFMNWQLEFILNQMQYGLIYSVIKKEEK